MFTVIISPKKKKTSSNPGGIFLGFPDMFLMGKQVNIPIAKENQKYLEKNHDKGLPSPMSSISSLVSPKKFSNPCEIFQGFSEIFLLEKVRNFQKFMFIP